jgi:hypothetical protein
MRHTTHDGLVLAPTARWLPWLALHEGLQLAQQQHDLVGPDVRWLAGAGAAGQRENAKRTRHARSGACSDCSLQGSSSCLPGLVGRTAPAEAGHALRTSLRNKAVKSCYALQPMACRATRRQGSCP